VDVKIKYLSGFMYERTTDPILVLLLLSPKLFTACRLQATDMRYDDKI